jgi:Holliday junction resolvasome RuvABC endonuclease subunit
MHLCLDLSLKSTGYSIFSKNGHLTEKNSIVPAKELSNAFKIHYIVSRLEKLYDATTDLIIEDLYFGKNFAGIRELARLSGAVLYSWVRAKYKEPIFYMASTARKLVGINGRAHKAEIQLWVLKKYFQNINITNYENEFNSLFLTYPIITARKGVSNEVKKISNQNKTKLKYKLNKLSIKIYEETGVGEDIADSIILGLAFIAESKKK